MEYDPNYRPVAYYFRKDTVSSNQLPYYPSYQPQDYQRVEASQIIRLYWRQFTGQTHGIPWMNAVARHMDLLSDFQRLVLQRAKNTTALNGYFERNPRDFDSMPDAGMTVLSPDSYITVPQGSAFRTVNATFPEAAYSTFNEGGVQAHSYGRSGWLLFVDPRPDWCQLFVNSSRKTE